MNIFFTYLLLLFGGYSAWFLFSISRTRDTLALYERWTLRAWSVFAALLCVSCIAMLRVGVH